MTEYNTGNAVHYGALAVKQMKLLDAEKFDLLSGKYDRFNRSRILHPKRLVEQSLRIVETTLDEVALHVPIAPGVTITIWHLRSQTYKPGPTVSIRVVFNKTRCWELASDSQVILHLSDPENYKLDMSSESKMKGFLRCVGSILKARMLVAASMR